MDGVRGDAERVGHEKLRKEVPKHDAARRRVKAPDLLALDDFGHEPISRDEGARDREIFTTDVIAMLHEGAGGLRDLDRLAEAAMRDAWRRRKKLVERDAVMRVVAADR